MKVRAIAVGFLDHLRQIGDEFEVPDGTVADWIEPIKKGGKKLPDDNQDSQSNQG